MMFFIEVLFMLRLCCLCFLLGEFLELGMSEGFGMIEILFFVYCYRDI